MTSYKYHPLNSERNEIRLLRVLPGDGDSDLCCEMEHVPLEPDLDYQALSYAWNDQQLFSTDDAAQALIVNGSVWSIGRNLASFLHHIRAKEESTGYFWVDALCINQNDVAERNSEVLRMSEIYRMARRVVVWLGAEGHDSDTALSFIKRQCGIGPSPRKQSSTEFTWWSASDLTGLSLAIRSQATVAAWKAIHTLLGRAWWRRTWVVQESVLSKELIFMCGRQTVTWLDLWYLLENLWAHSHWTRRVIPEGEELLSTSSPARTVLWLRSTWDKQPRDLLQALYHLRPTQTSDPRDKVYGLLGMASDAKWIVPSPNYSLTPMEVGISLLTRMTAVRKDLDWLTLAGDTEADALFPSWYPNLSKKSTVSSLNTSRSIAEGKTCGFHAAGDSHPTVGFDIPSLTCTAMGYLIDTVDGVAAGRGAHSSSNPNGDLVQASSQRTAYKGDAETFEAIWKTLVADQDFEGTTTAWRAPPHFGPLYAKKVLDAVDQPGGHGESGTGFDELGQWFMRNRNLVFAGKTLEDWTRAAATFIDDNATETDSFGFERRLYSTTSGRRLVITERGFLGIANESVRRGDHVCIFLGGRMPVVLRPTGTTYRFVCESYVHGLMDGEALDTVQCDAGSLRAFVLS